ncbi:MFS transporter [Derxia gummosa]|uniref:MFS transporter n=1 Tax=Derxia gummosa DSM 723 TaxID=1121388 RepID=A0A8B6X4C0_9BURK|nr:MFS transporter [Derxia gummosa]
MKQHKKWWVVLGALLGLLVGNGPIMQFTFGIFLVAISKDFGWSRGATSTGLVIGLTATGLLVPLAGRLIDRHGIRRVSLPAIWLFAAALGAMALLPPSLVLFYALYALMGVAAAGQTPLPYAKAISTWFDRRRGLALGIAMAGVGLGAALMPNVAQRLIAEGGWRLAYAGLAVLVAVIGTLAVGFLVEEAPTARGANGQRPDLPGETAREALRQPVFWKLALAFFAVACAANGTIAHLVPMLVDRGLPPAVGVGALAFAGLALTVGRLIAGWLLDRVHAPVVAAAFFVLPAVGILMLLSGPTPQLVTLCVVFIGLGLGAEVDLIAFLLSRYLGMRAFGEIYGWLFAVFMLGSGLGPALMGWSFDLQGSYVPGLAGACAALAIATALILRLGGYRYPEQAAAPAQPVAQPTLAH